MRAIQLSLTPQNELFGSALALTESVAAVASEAEFEALLLVAARRVHQEVGCGTVGWSETRWNFYKQKGEVHDTTIDETSRNILGSFGFGRCGRFHDRKGAERSERFFSRAEYGRRACSARLQWYYGKSGCEF